MIRYFSHPRPRLRAERVASRMRSRGFDKTKSRKFNGKVVARG